MGYIYKIINRINNKIYIGQTRCDVFERWRQHKKTKNSCRYLKSAFDKYGIERFDFKLICICFDEDLDKYERDYINKYNTIAPNGYNLREGGNGGRHNQETKIKISESLKQNRTNRIYCKSQLGKPHTEQIKNKISNALKGKKKNSETIAKRNLTISLYDEDKKKEIAEKISKTKKGNVKSSRIVEQYDLNMNFINFFPTINDAASFIGVCGSSISRCCKGQYKTVKGYIWRFKEKQVIS